ncbi:MAG: response regulator [Rhodanobacteraceae bacterium]|nr:response regulator [Rhodanobacteraceae bacterium]
MLRHMLEQNGYRPLEAFDAESGIQIAKESLPRLIFLDIVLPGMNGFAALRALRRDQLTADIPIIAMSGNDKPPEHFWAQKIGADDFHEEAVLAPEVFARVDRLLGGNVKAFGCRSWSGCRLSVEEHRARTRSYNPPGEGSARARCLS